MGLDWVLQDRVKVGSEERVAQTRDELARIEASAWRRVLQAGRAKSLRADLDMLAESPLAVLPCPRVGTHALADAWLREEWTSRQTEPPPATFVIGVQSAPREVTDPLLGPNFDDVRARLHGMPIIELCTEPDALPRWYGVAARRIDFRGQVMRDLEGLIDQELIDEAWEDHDAARMLDYASRLERAAKSISAPDEVTDKVQRLDVVDGAVRWLRFWGKRGFGYSAWF